MRVVYPDVRVVAVIEPDSLANLVTNLNVQKCANAQTTYKVFNPYSVSVLFLHRLQGMRYIRTPTTLGSRCIHVRSLSCTQQCVSDPSVLGIWMLVTQVNYSHNEYWIPQC